MKYTRRVKNTIFSFLLLVVTGLIAGADAQKKKKIEPKSVPQEETDTLSMLCIKDPYNPFLCASEITEMSS